MKLPRRSAPASLLRRNLLIYGLGGLIVPFVGIKLIDLLLVAAASGLRRIAMNIHRSSRAASLFVAADARLTGVVYPLRRHRHRPASLFPTRRTAA